MKNSKKKTAVKGKKGIPKVKKATIPGVMTAMVVRDGRLVPATVPVPKPGRGEVLVKVHAAGVNRPDVLQRRGLYPPPPGVTEVPGLEIAGTIVTKDGRAGRKVCALVPGGGYAEYCVAAESLCLPLPSGFDFVRAAALPETYFTVWRNVFGFGGLKKGETLLVHGGASGIGTTAVQLGAAFGATVFATAGTERKVKACKRLGAKGVVNYREADFVEEIMKATKGRGVDVVLDMVGGDYVVRNIAAMAAEGRHVSIATLRGASAPVDIRAVMKKRLTLTGSTLRAQPGKAKAKIARELAKQVWPLLSKGRVKPVIEKVYKLSEAQDAHDALEAGHHVGKYVLKVR